MTAAPPRASVDTAVRVVDGTGFGLGGAVRDTLARTHGPAVLVESRDLRPATPTVLLLPASFGSAGRTLAGPLFVLGRIAATGAPRLVLAWCVPSTDRRRFAAPSTPAGGRWNASDLVLGDAWRTELGRHENDSHAAAACRAARVERAVRADSHRTLGGADVRALLADVERIDPPAVHALLTEAGMPSGARWTALDALAAAIALRLRTRP